MKKIEGKEERTPEEVKRLGNVHVALQFLFIHVILFHCPENGNISNCFYIRWKYFFFSKLFSRLRSCASRDEKRLLTLSVLSENLLCIDKFQ